MSIWTKPIFGTKAGASTPATPVAIRCARMKTLRQFETLRLFFVGHLGALSVFFLIANYSLLGGPVKASTVVQRLSRLITGGTGWQAFVIIGVVILFQWFAAPAIGRFMFDRRERTMEQLAQARRHRRKIKWFVGGYLRCCAGCRC